MICSFTFDSPHIYENSHIFLYQVLSAGDKLWTRWFISTFSFFESERQTLSVTCKREQWKSFMTLIIKRNLCLCVFKVGKGLGRYRIQKYLYKMRSHQSLWALGEKFQTVCDSGESFQVVLICNREACTNSFFV